MTKGMKALKELKKHHYGTLEEFDRKLSVIEKELKALDILMEDFNLFINADNWHVDLLTYAKMFKDKFWLLGEVFYVNK